MNPYRPSNGTEGCSFYSRWCEKCKRDANMNSGKDWDNCEDSEICSIIADTLAYDIGHPKYPKEWIYGKAGPMCTAFLPLNAPPERCKFTIDMFGEAA